MRDGDGLGVMVLVGPGRSEMRWSWRVSLFRWRGRKLWLRICCDGLYSVAYCLRSCDFLGWDGMLVRVLEGSMMLD